eukprot:scaffold300_cov258-Pinguiococcus_pyrenoidosus.AAC.49
MAWMDMVTMTRMQVAMMTTASFHRCEEYWLLELDEAGEDCRLSSSGFWGLVIVACVLGASIYLVPSFLSSVPKASVLTILAPLSCQRLHRLVPVRLFHLSRDEPVRRRVDQGASLLFPKRSIPHLDCPSMVAAAIPRRSFSQTCFTRCGCFLRAMREAGTAGANK